MPEMVKLGEMNQTLSCILKSLNEAQLKMEVEFGSPSSLAQASVFNLLDYQVTVFLCKPARNYTYYKGNQIKMYVIPFPQA